jgi:hypothetical protein
MARSREHCYCGKAVTTYFRCVSATLVIQHAMRMHPTTLSSVTCLSLKYFCTFYINGTTAGKYRSSKIKYVYLILCSFSMKRFSLQYSYKVNEILWYICTGPHLNYLLLFSRFSKTLISSIRFREISKYKISIGTAVQTRRPRVRLPMVPLEFFIDTILPVTPWPWSWLSL